MCWGLCGGSLGHVWGSFMSAQETCRRAGTVRATRPRMGSGLVGRVGAVAEPWMGRSCAARSSMTRVVLSRRVSWETQQCVFSTSMSVPECLGRLSSSRGGFRSLQPEDRAVSSKLSALLSRLAYDTIILFTRRAVREAVTVVTTTHGSFSTRTKRPRRGPVPATWGPAPGFS